MSLTTHICLISSRFPPQRSAVGDYALRLSEALLERGAQVRVLTGPASADEKLAAGIRISVLDCGWGIRGMRLILKILRRERPQIVNLQYVPQMYQRYGIALPVALLPLVIRLFVGTPVVTTCHEFVGARPRSLKAALLQAFYALQTFLILLASNRVVVPVERHIELLKKYFSPLGGKARLIPVGSNIPVRKNSSGAGDDGRVCGDEWTIATLGTGHPWWNYELALHTVRDLRNKGYQVRLRCIGDIAGSNPAYFARLRALSDALGLNENVTWTGYCRAEQVSEFLSDADVFFFTQSTGPTMRSTALMAALAHGLPVVAARGTDTCRFLAESGAIQFVPADAPAPATAKIATLLRDDRWHREWAKRARELYERQFSWSKIAGQYLDVFAEAMSRERREELSPAPLQKR